MNWNAELTESNEMILFPACRVLQNKFPETFLGYMFLNMVQYMLHTSAEGLSCSSTNFCKMRGKFHVHLSSVSPKVAVELTDVSIALLVGIINEGRSEDPLHVS